MKRLVFLAVLAVLTLGCGSTRPMTRAEMWPEFNKDSMRGIVILEGPASCILTFYSATTREKLFSWSDRGENPSLTINGRVFARVYDGERLRLPKDNYLIEVETFYYANNFFPPERKRIPLSRYTTSVIVGNNPRAYPEREYKFEDYGWGLKIYTGDIPQYHYQSPKIDVQVSDDVPILTPLVNGIVRFVGGIFQ